MKLFLQDTEQAISDGMYIKKCLGVIEKSNYINKAVLIWRAQPLVDRTVALLWPFITAAHKKQRLKLCQGNNEQASRAIRIQEKTGSKFTWIRSKTTTTTTTTRRIFYSFCQQCILIDNKERN